MRTQELSPVTLPRSVSCRSRIFFQKKIHFVFFLAILFTNRPLPIREKQPILNMEASTVSCPVVREPDPSEAKKPRKPKHCKWRGWVNPENINRKHTEIMNRLKYFALFPNAYNNGWQHFELHTGKDAMSDSQVVTLLGNDLQSHRNLLQLMPLKKEDKFSDNTNATFRLGDPDFNPDSFLINRGVEIKECVCEIGEDEASKKSTERIHTEEFGPTKTKPEARYS